MKQTNKNQKFIYGRPLRSELTVSNESRSSGNSLLGILLSVLVLIAISSLIVAAIVVVNPEITSSFSGQRASLARDAISLEEAMLGELQADHFYSQWLDTGRGPAGQPQMDELIYDDSRNIMLLGLPARPSWTNDEPAAGSNKESNISETGNHHQPTSSLKVKLDLDSQKSVRQLVGNSSLLAGALDYQGFSLSPSKRYLLIWTNRKRQFRHSSLARYFVYDIQEDLITQLTTRPDENLELASYQSLDSVAQRTTGSGSAGRKRQKQRQFAGNQKGPGQHETDQDSSLFQLVNWFSLNGTDALVLVQTNDVYLLTKLDPKEATATSDISSDQDSIQQQQQQQQLQMQRITWDGKPGEFFNGVPDWLYEEEILSDRLAYDVSPSGQSLAFLSFDDSRLDEIPFSLYGDLVVPRVRMIRYPKAGRVNPRVSIRVVGQLNNLPDNNSNNNYNYNTSQQLYQSVQLPAELASRQHYITQIKWLTDRKLAAVWLNRHQNESQILICQPPEEQEPNSAASSSSADWTCKSNLELEMSNGWLEMSDSLMALDESQYLTLLYRHYGGDIGYFKQVALVNLKQPNEFKFLTDTHSEVTQIEGVDREKSIVYYTATPEDEPGQRQIYWSKFELGFSGTNNQHQSTNTNKPPTDLTTTTRNCLTCDLYPKECLYNSIQLSPSTSYYIFECHGPGVPRIELHVNKLASRLPESLLSSSSSTATSLNSNNSSYKAPATISELRASSIQLQRLEQAPIQEPEIELADLSSNKLPVAQQELPAISASGSLIWSIEDNQALRERVTNQLAMPISMRLRVPIKGTNYSANVLLLLPPQLGSRTVFKAPPTLDGATKSNYELNLGRRLRKRSTSSSSSSSSSMSSDGFEQALDNYLDESSIGLYSSQLASGQQFPMLVDVYAGPGTQAVDFRYKINFGHYLASSRRIIYCQIDGRGSGYQGTKRMFELYHKLGTVEIDDQINTVAQLTKQLNFIDASKVAIWGWSYGGYASAMALAKSQQLFLLDQLKHMQQQQQSSKGPTSGQWNSTSSGQLAVDNKLANLLSSVVSSGSSSSPAARHQATSESPHLLQQQQQSSQHQLRNNHQHKLNKPRTSGGVFECAASVAPVTNWLLYDTAYTERFMSSPYASELFDDQLPGDHQQQQLSSPLPAQQSSTTTNQTNKSHTINLMNELTRSNDIINSNHHQQQQPHQKSATMLNHWARFNQTTSTTTKIHSMAQQLQWTNKTSSNFQQHHHSQSPMANSNSIKSLDVNQRYRQSSLLDKIHLIDRKRFLVIHGTADDNVHFQQSVMLMKRLIQSNVMFESRLYPDQDHSIGNRADKLHLGSTLDNFMTECFDMSL